MSPPPREGLDALAPGPPDGHARRRHDAFRPVVAARQAVWLCPDGSVVAPPAQSAANLGKGDAQHAALGPGAPAAFPGGRRGARGDDRRLVVAAGAAAAGAVRHPGAEGVPGPPPGRRVEE